MFVHRHTSFISRCLGDGVYISSCLIKGHFPESSGIDCSLSRFPNLYTFICRHWCCNAIRALCICDRKFICLVIQPVTSGQCLLYRDSRVTCNCNRSRLIFIRECVIRICIQLRSVCSLDSGLNYRITACCILCYFDGHCLDRGIIGYSAKHIRISWNHLFDLVGICMTNMSCVECQ